MVQGGHRHRRGVHVRAIQQLGDGAAGARAELCGEGLGAGKVGVHDRRQFDRVAAFLQLVVDARMVAPECPGADDGNFRVL